MLIERRRVWYPYIGDKSIKQVTITRHDVTIMRETAHYYVLANGKKLKKHTVTVLEG